MPLKSRQTPVFVLYIIPNELGVLDLDECAFLLLKIHNGIGLFWHLHYHYDIKTAFMLEGLSSTNAHYFNSYFEPHL